MESEKIQSLNQDEKLEISRLAHTRRTLLDKKITLNKELRSIDNQLTQITWVLRNKCNHETVTTNSRILSDMYAPLKYREIIQNCAYCGLELSTHVEPTYA